MSSVQHNIHVYTVMYRLRGLLGVGIVIFPISTKNSFISICICVEPSQAHGLVLVWSLIFTTMVSTTLACSFTAMRDSICIRSRSCSIPAYARFWYLNLNGFQFFRRHALRTPISSKSRSRFFYFLLFRKIILKNW